MTAREILIRCNIFNGQATRNQNEVPLKRFCEKVGRPKNVPSILSGEVLVRDFEPDRPSDPSMGTAPGLDWTGLLPDLS